MHRGRVFSEKRRSEALKNEGVGVDESSLVLGRTRRHCQTSKSKMGLIGRRKYDTLPVFEAEYGCGATTTALMVNPDLVLSDVDTEFAIAGERG
ncbi:hypothetical protein C2857_006215 [Epichloe festucae Fl1]|uniref:Uncharacterized protein n=1 Tax=Epichloe festucae (strain Fl1) TaxID=877507 RepID=A0A7S9KLG7_EPIFF|nr:hypothetical protein C2857_006215 [Epichloe festucae Fl1]